MFILEQAPSSQVSASGGVESPFCSKIHLRFAPRLARFKLNLPFTLA